MVIATSLAVSALLQPASATAAEHLVDHGPHLGPVDRGVDGGVDGRLVVLVGAVHCVRSPASRIAFSA